MNYIPLLPPLREDKTPSNFEVPGEWLKRNSADLYGMIQSLQVKGAGANYRKVDSIPYMWARPLLFEMALCDANHPLDERIRGEWRGLLALFALKEWYRFPLKIAPIEILHDEDDNDTDEAEAPEFLVALRDLLPRHTLDASTTWDRLDVILFDDAAIGITSPTTLVSTAADYSNSLSRVLWFDGQFLTDPVSQLNDAAKEALAGWLRKLNREAIDGLPKLGDNLPKQIEDRIKEIANDLNGELTAFIDELGGDPEKPPVFSTNVIGFAQPLFRHGMGAPAEPGEFASSVKVVPSRDRCPGTELLIVDETIADYWGADPQNVIVWGIMTLAEYKDSIDKRLPPVPERVRFRKPKDLFTNQLCVIVQEDAFGEDTLSAQGSGDLQFQGSRVTPIPPIKQELLTYLDAENLNERITFQESDGGIVVTIRITLTGTNGKERDFPISREYLSHDGDIRSVNRVPVLEIWPNFKAEMWKAYYTYFTMDGEVTFYARPLAPAEGVSESSSFEITKTCSFPEAMICEYDGAQVGILLIKAEEVRVDEDTTWSIGVDFGTTSTIVYRNHARDEPKEVKFNPRLLHITHSSQPNRLIEDFVPAESIPSPFLSLFQTFTSSGRKPQELLLDGHIYFPNETKNLRDVGGIISDLKWSSSPQVRNLARIFLKQVCLHCAAESIAGGAGEISWRFSFPSAFSQADREQFRQIWRDVVEHCFNATGMRTVDVSHKPESIVAPKFFASELQSKSASGAFTSGAVCIDIGGETSDISIWQDNELYWRSSLRFAGRHIFLDWLKASPGILRRFDVESRVITALEEASDVSPDDFYAQADAIIKHQSQDWLKDFAIQAGQSDVKTFVRFIATGISGLLFYVGLVLKYLAQEKCFDQHMPSVYFGGNGSRILHWLGNGEFAPESDNKRLLETVLLDASGFDYNNGFDIEISKLPKHEAAYGLVTDEVKLHESNENSSSILAGETFEEDGEDMEWKEILTADRLKKGLRMSKRLEQMHNFVESFNKHTGVGKAIETPIHLRSEDVRFIVERLRGKLQNQKDADPNAIHVESLFILSLKLFLQRLGQNR